VASNAFIHTIITTERPGFNGPVRKSSCSLSMEGLSVIDTEEITCSEKDDRIFLGCWSVILNTVFLNIILTHLAALGKNLHEAFLRWRPQLINKPIHFHHTNAHPHPVSGLFHVLHNHRTSHQATSGYFRCWKTFRGRNFLAYQQ